MNFDLSCGEFSWHLSVLYTRVLRENMNDKKQILCPLPVIYRIESRTFQSIALISELLCHKVFSLQTLQLDETTHYYRLEYTAYIQMKIANANFLCFKFFIYISIYHLRKCPAAPSEKRKMISNERHITEFQDTITSMDFRNNIAWIKLMLPLHQKTMKRFRKDSWKTCHTRSHLKMHS